MAPQRAERADVTLAQSLFGSGIDLCKRGEFELAIAHLDRACELCPDDEDMQAARAQVRLLRTVTPARTLRSARRPNAPSARSSARRRMPRPARCYQLAMNAVEGNDLERALRLAEKAHRLDRRSLAISALLNSLQQALAEAEDGEEEEWPGDEEGEEEEEEEDEGEEEEESEEEEERALPPGWSEGWSERAQRRFYYRSDTGQAQWEWPDDEEEEEYEEDEDEDEAAALHRQGAACFNDGDTAAALRLLRASVRLNPRPHAVEDLRHAQNAAAFEAAAAREARAGARRPTRRTRGAPRAAGCRRRLA